MLKIKDNVDIKEFEKYGFRFEYSSQTGELIKAIKVDNRDRDRRINIVKNKRRKTRNIIKLVHTHIFNDARDYGNKKIGFQVIDSISYGDERFDLDTLYDLIKADLVEKV